MNYKTILAFGAHPDDVEFGCGGTLLLLKELGYKIKIIDLTRGEKSIHGRNDEDAISAAKLMDVERSNLNFGDKNVNYKKNYQKQKLKEIIDQYSPEIILTPYFVDQHTDHVNTSKLVNKISKPIYYYINDLKKANYGVNISKVYNKKLELLRCHKRQAKPGDWKWVEERNRNSGKRINSEYGELFFIKNRLDLPKIFIKLK